MRIFFLGTCRVNNPAAELRARGYDARATPHRSHSLKQALQFAREIFAGVNFFTPESFALVSEHAAERVAAGDSKESVLAEFGKLPETIRRSHKVAIEVSTLREYPLRQADGTILYLDKRMAPLVAEPQLLTVGEAVATMREIKRHIPRPIVWIPHITPPPTEGLDAVIKTRRNLADVVRQGANILGDRFFDPAIVAEKLGSKEFFMSNGADTEHPTASGVTALANHYEKFFDG